ncbi:MAG: anthranilate phosphoribosyltransferase, partial [Planctomycetes bacterium]|nr:anthranilate phosphoribosyltransferase [Planctomycetota bacterium]
AEHIKALLNGTSGPRRNAVLLNAGFVAALADKAPGPAEGVRLARETIESGRADRLLRTLCETSRRLADSRHS